MNKAATVICSLMTTLACAAWADEHPAASASLVQACETDAKGDKKDDWRRAPKAESLVTHPHMAVGGKTIDYNAAAGVEVIRDDEDKPIANMGYVAYTRRDTKDTARPIMFAFNGGPGSSSLW